MEGVAIVKCSVYLILVGLIFLCKNINDKSDYKYAGVYSSIASIICFGSLDTMSYFNIEISADMLIVLASVLIVCIHLLFRALVQVYYEK